MEIARNTFIITHIGGVLCDRRTVHFYFMVTDKRFKVYKCIEQCKSIGLNTLCMPVVN